MSWARVFSIILAIGLSTFAFLEYKKKQESDSEERRQSLLFKDEIKQEELVQVLLEKFDKVHFELVRKGIYWNLAQPVADRAHLEKVDAFIANILEQKVDPIDDDVVDWSEYDLDDPSLTLTLKDENNRVWKVEVSGEPNFDKRYFLKKDNQLFIGSKDWNQIALTWPDEYRSKRLYPIDKNPTQFSFKMKNKSYDLKYENQRWVWNNKASFPLSSSAVEDFFNLLKTDMIQNVISERSAELDKKWSQPDAELVFSGEELGSLKFKKMPAGHSQVVVSSRPFVFDINKNHTEQILEADFRDHRAPFKWDLRKLDQIEVQSADINFVVKNVSSKKDRKDAGFPWEVAEPADHQVNKDDFNSFLDWLGDLEAKNYHNKPVTDKVARIILKDKDEKIIFQMDLAMEVKKDNPDELEKVYAQVNSQGSSMDIDVSSFQQAFKKSIIEKFESDE